MIPPPLGFQPQPQKNKSDLKDLLKSYINSNKIKFKIIKALIGNLKTQVGQLASLLSKRSQGFLLGNTKKNPKEYKSHYT